MDNLSLTEVLTYSQFIAAGVGVINTVVLFLTLLAVIYYAYQAKKQVEKTREIALHAQNQVKAANDLVILAGKEYEPRAAIRVIETLIPGIEPPGTGFFIIDRLSSVGVVDVNIKNLSKGPTECSIDTRTWLLCEKRGPARNTSFRDNILNWLSPGLPSDNEPLVLLPDEVITGRLHLQFSGILRDDRGESYHPITNTDLSRALLNAYLIIEFSVSYPRNPATPTVYRDLFLGNIIPTVRQAPDIVGDYLTYIEWVYGARIPRPFVDREIDIIKAACF